jgi:pSer/pThr/pTyr-binding forkhead associated (FHA) protein
MPKFCNNGHQMEDSWDVCPYCQRAGFQGAGGAAALAKTRLEFDPSPQPAAPGVGPGAVPAARKTVLLSDRPKGALVGWLVAMSGAQKGDDFRVREGQNAIGSAPENEVVIKDPAVSGKHASLRCKDKKFLLTDLDSTNGTFLNDGAEPISLEELRENDTIRVGNTVLKFKVL